MRRGSDSDQTQLIVDFLAAIFMLQDWMRQSILRSPERLKKECPAELGRFGKGQSLAMKVIRSIGSLSRCKGTCGLPDNETKHKGKETVSHYIHQSNPVWWGKSSEKPWLKKTQSKAYTKATRRHTAHTEIV